VLQKKNGDICNFKLFFVFENEDVICNLTYHT